MYKIIHVTSVLRVLDLVYSRTCFYLENKENETATRKKDHQTTTKSVKLI